MYATRGRGFFVLLNGHGETPKKSVRLAFKPSQRRERINPFAGVGCARQTTFFVPRRDRQSQENFILHQLRHIQFACHRQEIPGVIFQLVLRHVGAFRNKFQSVVDIKIVGNGAQAALASQGENPRDFHVQQELSARPF